MEQPSTAPAATGHKTYVFVDEYNRHKRLKVMRACDGCRKRKIRCDGALQNGPWPCGACLRLKLKCVPPTLDQEDDLRTPDSATSSSQFSFHTATAAPSAKSNGVPPSQSTMVHEWSTSPASTAPVSHMGPTSAPMQADVNTAAYSSQMFSQHLGPRLDPGYSDDEYFASTTAGATQYQSNRPAPPSLLRTQTEASSSSGGEPQEVDAAVRELSEQMGDLSIDLTSVAPYIANEKRNLAETPAVEEVDVVLPPSVATDSTVRIPSEMMPSEERAMDYFGYFFDYIHPYVPVLNRQAFYDQWRTARHSISPLILEGIFACVARYLEEPIEVRRWLALGSRHEESFKDVPRLSTIQAMLILTKAREFIPKRGYYYRSWMTVKYMTTMAFDLGLHEHYDQHRTGVGCKFNKSDCMIRTRIWQTLFLVEILVGAPQGRTDFAVEVETVDCSIPTPSPSLDAYEHKTSRRAAFFTQAIRNIKQTNILWQAMRRYKKDWALDPMFVRQNEVINTWLKTLPPDLQMQYPEDDTPPWLGGEHHVAYLHSYHHLVVIMHHRPQLQALLEKGDPNFRVHLDICNDSASLICRLQEALYRDFGLHGLQFMQRGIGFTIYCVLTCTMLHLATITSPDAVVNQRARNYFTRHMRILEHCNSSAGHEIQLQIHALREAFSEDTSKPFELKQTLGLRSPSIEKQSPPTSMLQTPQSAPVHGTPGWSHLQDAASSKTMSPASEYSQPFDHVHSAPPMPYNSSSFAVPAVTSFASTTLHPVASASQQGYALQQTISNDQSSPVWDPSGIFNQWNTAFGAPTQPPQPSPPQPPDPRIPAGPTSGTIISPPQHPSAVPQQQPLYTSQQIPAAVNAGIQEPVPAMPAVPTVTPVMWQDAFTNAYASGHGGSKRYRDDTLDTHPYDQYPKRRG